MRNINDDTEWNRRSSQPEVVKVGDVVVQDGQQRSRSDSTYSADLETAITKTGCGKFNIALLLLTFPATSTFNFDTGSMSYIIPTLSIDLGLTPSERALLQSSCYAGMVLSGLFWGFMSDAFGRKKLLVIGFLLDALMNILAGVFPILPLMVVFKFLSGFMICGAYPVFATYIAEVHPIKIRDRAILSMGLYGSIGQIIQAGLAMWIIPAEVPSEIPFKSWQLFQMACSVPSLISGIGCIFFVESPKFLIDKGNHEGALKVCQTIYSINTGNLSTTYPIKKLNHNRRKTENKSSLSKVLEGIEIFKSPFVQKALIMFLMHLGGIGSYNIVRLWLPEMLTLLSSSTLDPKQGLCPLLHEGNLGRSNLTSANLNGEKVFSKMMWVTGGCIVAEILFLVLVTYTGKKMIQLSCTLVGAMCSLIIPFISANYGITLAAIFMAVYDVCVHCNINIVVEIFPTRIRATSVGLMMFISKTGTVGLNFLVTNFAYNYCEYLFYGMSFASLIMAGLALAIPKKPIEDKLLNPSKGN